MRFSVLQRFFDIDTPMIVDIVFLEQSFHNVTSLNYWCQLLNNVQLSTCKQFISILLILIYKLSELFEIDLEILMG